MGLIFYPSESCVTKMQHTGTETWPYSQAPAAGIAVHFPPRVPRGHEIDTVRQELGWGSPCIPSASGAPWAARPRFAGPLQQTPGGSCHHTHPTTRNWRSTGVRPQAVRSRSLRRPCTSGGTSVQRPHPATGLCAPSREKPQRLCQPAQAHTPHDTQRAEPVFMGGTAHPQELCVWTTVTPVTRKHFLQSPCNSDFRSTRGHSTRVDCHVRRTQNQDHSSDSRDHNQYLPLWHKGSKNSCKPLGMFLTTSQE